MEDFKFTIAPHLLGSLSALYQRGLFHHCLHIARWPFSRARLSLSQDVLRLVRSVTPHGFGVLSPSATGCGCFFRHRCFVSVVSASFGGDIWKADTEFPWHGGF